MHKVSGKKLTDHLFFAVVFILDYGGKYETQFYSFRWGTDIVFGHC